MNPAHEISLRLPRCEPFHRPPHMSRTPTTTVRGLTDLVAAIDVRVSSRNQPTLVVPRPHG